MKTFYYAILLLVPALLACQQQRMDSSLLTQEEGDPIQHFVEETSTPDDALRKAHAFRSFTRTDRDQIGQMGIEQIEQILNLGLKVWDVVEKNKAVTQSESLFANGLPNGVQSADELEHFSDLQYRSYHRYGVNPFGVEVYRIDYTVVHRYGGTYKKRGQYLENVSIIPNEVTALWGYTVDMSVAASKVANVGSEEDPIAALLLTTTMKISTMVKSSEIRETYQFRGDSKTHQNIGSDALSSRRVSSFNR